MPGRLARDKKGAQEDGARLAFLDESGFSERPPVRTTWSPKGVTPVIRHHFNWKRINAFGVITCRPDGSDPDLLLSWQEESIDAESVARFLTELKKQTEGTLILLWDGLPAHRSKVVKVHINLRTGLAYGKTPSRLRTGVEPGRRTLVGTERQGSGKLLLRHHRAGGRQTRPRCRQNPKRRINTTRLPGWFYLV